MRLPLIHQLPIRQKLIAISIFVAGSALFLFSLVSMFNQVRVMRQAMLDNLTIIAESVADLSIAALSFTDRNSAEEILNTLKADSDIEAALLLDSDGELFANYFRDDDAAALALLHAVDGSGSGFFFHRGIYRLEISQQVSMQGRTLGTLYLLSGTGRMVGHIRNSTLLLLLSVIGVMGVTVLIAARLQGLITEPVSQLARTARDISMNGDYSLRVKKQSDDEIGQLVDDFNTMLSDIQERDAELQRHRQNLESLVEERTEELRAKRDEALAAARAKSEFLANMSHEIRTPMNGVIGVLSLLQDVPMTAEYRRLLDTATRSADSLLLIINDILDFSKIDAGKITFEAIGFDLRALMEETSELFIDTINLKNLELTCFVPSHIPCRIQGDPTRLRQILTNLLSNAVKFTDTGEVRLAVSVISREENAQELLFTVEDTGIGIPREVTGNLFEKFTQADGSTTRKYGGTGLGLSVCKQLVEQQGGRIGVSSKLGSGSTFWFSLRFPIVEETFPLIPYRKLQGKRYLLVEKSAASRSIIEHYLRHCDAEVVTSVDGRTCMDALARLMDDGRGLDAILIEQRLPDDDGLHLASAIRLQYGEQSPPMVIMSSMTFAKAQLRRAGVKRSLLKPIRQLDLYASLTEDLPQMKTETSQEFQTVVKEPLPALCGSLLLVDDEPINQKIALAILQKFGMEAEVAASGTEAVAMTENKKYSVVLMDIQMPEMSGFEATQLIRRREEERGEERTIIIAMTANAMESTRNRCFEVGMDDFFTKPIKPDVLAERLSPWLGTRIMQGRETTQHGIAPPPDGARSAGGAAGQQRLWNIEKALEFVGGDEELLKDMASLFIDRSDVLLRAVESAVEDGDPMALRDAAHAYKGAVGHFAAEEVRQLALRLEAMGKDGEMQAGNELLRQLREKGGRLVVELGAYLQV